MEGPINETAARGSVTIGRSKHRISVVDWWYRRLLLMPPALTAFFFLCYLFTDSKVIANPLLWKITIIATCCFSLFYSFINKGSLVEEVTVDYDRREIRVLRYDLRRRKHQEVISLEGFKWSVMSGGKSPNRLRICPAKAPRLVICESSLGWTTDDCLHLHRALTAIVEREDKLWGIKD